MLYIYSQSFTTRKLPFVWDSEDNTIEAVNSEDLKNYVINSTPGLKEAMQTSSRENIETKYFSMNKFGSVTFNKSSQFRGICFFRTPSGDYVLDDSDIRYRTAKSKRFCTKMGYFARFGDLIYYDRHWYFLHDGVDSVHVLFKVTEPEVRQYDIGEVFNIQCDDSMVCAFGAIPSAFKNIREVDLAHMEEAVQYISDKEYLRHCLKYYNNQALNRAIIFG